MLNRRESNENVNFIIVGVLPLSNQSMLWGALYKVNVI